MKIALVALFFAVSASAQNPFTGISSACGPDRASFKVQLVDTHHAPAPPQPETAQVYFIHDEGADHEFAYPTAKLGIDGAWVGANHGNSWFSVSVTPGEHHVCAALQSSIVDQRVELAHFTAEAAKVYYFRTRLVMSRQVELLELQPLDSDQGRCLVAAFPLSVSTLRK
jgi:hypothetical protein